MKGFIFNTANSFALLLGQDGIFIVFSSVAIISCLINLFIASFVTDYGVKKRLWQPCVSVFAVAVCAGVCAVANYGFYLPLFVCGVSVISVIPVFAVRTKTFKITQKQRDLVKYIDGEIKRASDRNPYDFSYDNTIIEKPVSVDKTIDERDARDFDLDFQHVKNVISRLDYFGLKENDKRQVKELENALLVAEKGNFNKETKCKINDGLGALLKIMSKYGV